MKFKRFKKKSDYKICPRCGMKSLASAETCSDCGLVFSRLVIATNKDAKKKIKNRDKDFIIMTNQLPADVSYLKLLLSCIFGGLLGAHCFSVGRYWRGSILLINTLILIMFVVFNQNMIEIDGGTLLGALATLCGMVMIVWPIDIVLIIMKKFKVPIAIDIDSQIEVVENSEQ